MAPRRLTRWRVGAVAAAVAACGEAPTLPSEPPEFSGLVGSVSRAGGVTSVGLLLTATWVGGASTVDVVIQVPGHRVIFVSADGGATRQGRAGQIAVGDRLDAWSAGACLRSLPPICQAREVLLSKAAGQWAVPPSGAAPLPR